MAPEGIAKPGHFNEIDIASKHLLEFIDHVQPLKKAPGSIGLEAHKHIDITIRSEIFPQSRPEDGKFDNSPFAAKFGYEFRIYFKWPTHGMLSFHNELPWAKL